MAFVRNPVWRSGFFARITYPVFFTMCIMIPPKLVILTVGRNSKIVAHNYATIIYEYWEKSRRFRGGRIRPAAAGPRRLRVSTGHSLRAAFRIRLQREKVQHRKVLDFLWWGRTDSNHRSETQQIYSLSPLATRELPRMKLSVLEPVDGLEPPTY